VILLFVLHQGCWGWQACTTMLSHWLRWGPLNFFAWWGIAVLCLPVTGITGKNHCVWPGRSFFVGLLSHKSQKSPFVCLWFWNIFSVYMNYVSMTYIFKSCFKIDSFHYFCTLLKVTCVCVCVCVCHQRKNFILTVQNLEMIK
jgi:hypothetical protein